MGTSRLRLILTALMVGVAFQSAVFADRWNIEDPSVFPGVWYRIDLGNDGRLESGAGDGDGWHYYPESGSYRMWFHNGDFDLNRKGRLYYHVYAEALDVTKSTYAEISFVWTSEKWSQAGHKNPPYPSDVPTLNDEYSAMSGESIMNIDWHLREGSSETEASHVIQEYNPEWVGIEIEGRNLHVCRGAFHECLPKDAGLKGACCNRQNGNCYTTTQENCTAPDEWLGPNTSCDACGKSPTASVDFGDARDPTYPTLLASNGARHTIVPGLFLGRGVDAEPDGKPTALADGDDRNAQADEDGVVFTSALQAGTEASIEVTASAQGYLNAWIDFDADGSFAGRGEQIFSDRLLASGVNRLIFPVPVEAASGPTFARFRFNSRGLLDFDGPASDGEVEDYRIETAKYYEPHAISGATALLWSRPPSVPGIAEPYLLDVGGELSALHLHQIAADDWHVQDSRPVTGIHWWGTFDGWTESSLPPRLPLAFHIGIWTDMPDPEPYNFETFSHPDTLVWESYCTNWVWALSGYEAGGEGQLGKTCFQFTHLLSQDQWFHINQVGSAEESRQPMVYWLSIAAIYDPKAAEPANVWTWKTRPGGSTAAGTSIQGIVASPSAPSWPPTPGSRWQEGRPIRNRLFEPVDMAFQLTTYAPVEYESTETALPKVSAAAGVEDLTALATHWLASME